MRINPGIRNLEESIEQERPASRIMEEVINLLPDYIPSEVRASLLSSHPTLRVSLISEKDSTAGQYDDDEYFDEIPEEIREEDIPAYFNGIELLEELAIESLTIAMLSRVVNIEKHEEIYSTEITDILKQQLDKNNEGRLFFEGLLQALHVSMLTGNSEQLNEYIRTKSKYQNINELAVEIGKGAENKGGENSQSGIYDPRVFGEIKISKDNLKEMLSYSAGSVISLSTAFLAIRETFEKGIQFHSWNQFNHSIGVATAAGILSFIFGTHLKDALQSGMHIALHEILHFLTHDPKANRLGLTYIKKSP